MKRSIVSTAAFSLVELTLAIGIAAFCLIAVFGLMPVGVQTNRNATSQTAATNIIASVIADMRATPGATSAQYGIHIRQLREYCTSMAQDSLRHCWVRIRGIA